MTLSQEVEKVKKEKFDSERSLKTHHEMFALAAKEALRQKELVAELHRLITLAFPHLGHDLQETVATSLETMRDNLVDTKLNAPGIRHPQRLQPSKVSIIKTKLSNWQQTQTQIQSSINIIINPTTTHSNRDCEQTPDPSTEAIGKTDLEKEIGEGIKQNEKKKRTANEDNSQVDDQTNASSTDGSSSMSNDENRENYDRPSKKTKINPETNKPENASESQTRAGSPTYWQPWGSNPLNIPGRHFTPNEAVVPPKEFAASSFGAATRALNQSDFSLFVDWEGGVEKVDFTYEPCIVKGYPVQAQPLIILNHEGPVSSVVLHSDNDKQLAFSGGKGRVKIWDVGSKDCISQLECFQNKFIRTMKINRLDKTLVVGGETNQLIVWDIAQSTPRIRNRVDLDADSCYSMVLSSDYGFCVTCGDKGNVTAWDLRTQTSVRKFQGHVEGVACIDFSPNDSEIWTGGLDGTVRSWDVRDGRQLALFDLHSIVCALGCCPGGDCVAVAASSVLEILQPSKRGKYVCGRHYKDVTSLKFAKHGEWFVTTGKDGLVNLLRSPKGETMARIREPRVTTCDISDDSQFVGTGSMNGRIAIREVVF